MESMWEEWRHQEGAHGGGKQQLRVDDAVWHISGLVWLWAGHVICRILTRSGVRVPVSTAQIFIIILVSRPNMGSLEFFCP
jgi:hypothetical protein